MNQYMNITDFFSAIIEFFQKQIKNYGLYSNSIIISKPMQTTFNFSYDKIVAHQHQQDETPIKYILPVRPTDKYEEFKGKKFRKGFDEIQRCPFPKLRQMVMTYYYRDPKAQALQQHNIQSDVLNQKYAQDPILKRKDNSLIDKIVNLEIEMSKFEIIIQCSNEYKTLFSDLQRSAAERYNDELRNISRQAVEKKRVLTQHHSHSDSNILSIDERQEAQLKALINYYQQNQQKFDMLNDKILTTQNKYFQYIQYAKQFERILLLVVHLQRLIFGQYPEENIQNVTQFIKRLQEVKTSVSIKLQQLIKGLYKFRKQVKMGVRNPTYPEEEQHRQTKSFDQVMHEVHRLYFLMNTISLKIGSDRKNAAEIYQRFSKQYPNFLQQYIRVKQTTIMQKQIKRYVDIIDEEKILLIEHLKKNYGMMVPYRPSDKYDRFVSPLKDHDKHHLMQLIKNKVQPLQTAFLFINNQYDDLYKRVCKGEKINHKIESKIKQFQAAANVEQKKQLQIYNIHLLEACRKLLMLCK